MAEPVEKRRQQLRELDSLLEQMLALPISDRPRPVRTEAPPEPVPEEAPAPRSLVWPPRSERERHEVQAERVVTFISAEPEVTLRLQAPPDENVHLARDEGQHGKPEPTALGDDDLFVQEHWQAGLNDPTQVDVRPAAGLDLAKGGLLSLVGIPALEAQTAAVSPPAPPSAFQRLLMAVNYVYDRFCDTLWPFGGLLKWSGTRNLLGIIGIGLLMAAAVWLIVTQLVKPR